MKNILNGDIYYEKIAKKIATSITTVAIMCSATCIPDIQVSYHTSNRCNVSFKDFFAPAYGSGTTYVLIHTTNYKGESV